MLAKDSGHIINVTSSAGHVGYAGWGAYAVSKFAIEGLSYTLADELTETGVAINCLLQSLTFPIHGLEFV